jgi:peptidoglycan/LPS O-acetylase OafA/YrhL
LAGAYRAELDGLRGLAILIVVAYHFFPDWVRFGFIGVDIFFVLSGYLISSHLFTQLQEGRFSLLAFYQRRVVRLVPALLLVLVATLVYGWFNLLPAQFKELGKQVMGGAGFVANFLFWNEAGYFGGDAALKPLLHLWSLAIEEQFYLVWPLALMLLFRGRRGTVLATLALITLFSFGCNLWVMEGDKSAAFYWPFTRFWELSIGALVAWWHHRLVRRSLLEASAITPSPRPTAAPLIPVRWSTLLTACGLLLLAIAMVRITPQRPFPGTWALLPTLSTALFIAAGPKAFLNRIVLSNLLLRWPGKISYAWYLWHWPLLAFAHMERGEGLPLRVRWILLFTSCSLAVLTTYLVEHPLRFHTFWRARCRRLSAILLALLMVLGLAGWNIHARDGLSFRLPTVIRKMTEPPVDMFAGWGRGTCLLESHQTPQDYQAACIETKRPLLFVWGDSHAAALMPGLKAARDALPAPQSFGLGQRTSATCPPFGQGVGDAQCQAMNDEALAQIRSLRPEVVLMHAFWTFEFYDLQQIPATVQLLRLMGVQRVVLLGSPPGWQPPLPQQVLNAWEAGPAAFSPPFRLSKGVMPSTFTREAEVAKIAQVAGADYISLVDLMCNAQGCQTRETMNSEHLVSHDYGHLSLEAAIWVATSLMPQLQPR